MHGSLFLSKCNNRALVNHNCDTKSQNCDAQGRKLEVNSKDDKPSVFQRY